MGKLGALFGGYFNKPEGLRYIAICSRGSVLDYEGYLGTRRELWNFEEFKNKIDLEKFLDNSVSKSERKHWKVYVEYRPPKTTAQKGSQ